MQEAIDFYEKFGQNMEKRDFQWKGWQQKLHGYLNEKCDRKIFQVFGKEGKTFFQRNIQLELGTERVSVIPLTENERNTFYVLKKYTSNNTDTFLFNIKRAQFITDKNYQILEEIKDCVVIYGNYLLKFKEKKFVIVFSNQYPDRSQLLKDRWKIFEIFKDLKDIMEEEMPEDSKTRTNVLKLNQ